MTRTERQQEAIKKWIKAKGKGTVVAPTGAGKTRIAIMSINAVRKKYPGIRVLVVGPTTPLKNQWEEEIYNWALSFNAEIQYVLSSALETATLSSLSLLIVKRLVISKLSPVK